MKQHLRRAFNTVALSLVAVCAVPSIAADTMTSSLDNVRAALLKKHPGNDAPTSVAHTPIPGLYEVLVGDQIFYTDESATHFIFNGQMVDLANQINITENRKNELLKVDMAALDPKDAIITRRGSPDPKRTLVVFSDPLCPYCQRLEAELIKMENIEIRTYLIPRPDAMGIAESIWCAKDPSQAWIDFMTNGVKPGASTCSHPIERTRAYAAKFGIRGTPTLLTLDGRRTGGYRPVDGIEAFLANLDKK